MKRRFAVVLSTALAFGLLAPHCSFAQTKQNPAPSRTNAARQNSEHDVVALLRDFLAHVSDPAMHERFWADDVVYTGSNGKFRAKPEIVKNVREGGLKAPGDPEPVFTAEDITVHVFGDTAVVAFRLVHQSGDTTEDYRNTGTFLRRKGQWQVVAWQATKVPEEKPEEIK